MLYLGVNGVVDDDDKIFAGRCKLKKIVETK